eukprot:jgi/Mesvir1/7368/Mv25803-RA.1
MDWAPSPRTIMDTLGTSMQVYGRVNREWCGVVWCGVVVNCMLNTPSEEGLQDLKLNVNVSLSINAMKYTRIVSFNKTVTPVHLSRAMCSCIFIHSEKN